MFSTKILKAVQDNQFHIVVWFLDAQLDITRRHSYIDQKV